MTHAFSVFLLAGVTVGTIFETGLIAVRAPQALGTWLATTGT